MDLARLFDELASAAGKVNVTVRCEPFDAGLSDARTPRGGLCTLFGQRTVLIDSRASLQDRVATLAAALAAVDLDNVFLPPIVRATIGAYGKHGLGGTETASQRAPLARAVYRGPPRNREDDDS